jgi:hypothetical protein
VFFNRAKKRQTSVQGSRRGQAKFSMSIPVFNYSMEDIEEIHEESAKIVEAVGQQGLTFYH